MKKIYPLFLLFSAFAINLSSQVNIVPNPGFETASPCPDYPGQTNYATGWNNVNLVYSNPSVGTPDYFHACGSASLGYNCAPPNTFSGICSPKTGNGMMSSVLYNSPYPDYREYFSTQLTTTMTVGNTYTVSFWVTNGSTPYSQYSIKNIGINFSASPLTQSGWALINLSPQCEVTTQVASTSWVNYTFTVNPTSNWQYLTLGCFRTDASNNVVSTFTGTSGPPSVYARYYFDDLQVLSNAQGVKELNISNFDLSIYPNPTSNQINISSSITIEKVMLSNYLGQNIKTYTIDGNKGTIDISELTNGIYFAQFYHKGQIVAIKKIIKE